VKIVIPDGYTENPGDLSWEGLENIGELVVYDRTAAERVVEHVGAVYTNNTLLTGDTIERAPGLRFVGVLATGYNIVDVGAARELGLTVTNVPSWAPRESRRRLMDLAMENLAEYLEGAPINTV
jgi:glycerate dehydrogenase